MEQKPGAGCGCLAPLVAAAGAALLARLVAGAAWPGSAIAGAAAAAMAGLFMVIGESAIEDVVKGALVWVVAIGLLWTEHAVADAIGLGLLVGPLMGGFGNRVVEGARRRDAAAAVEAT